MYLKRFFDSRGIEEKWILQILLALVAAQTPFRFVYGEVNVPCFTHHRQGHERAIDEVHAGKICYLLYQLA